MSCRKPAQGFGVVVFVGGRVWFIAVTIHFFYHTIILVRSRAYYTPNTVLYSVQREFELSEWLEPLYIPPHPTTHALQTIIINPNYILVTANYGVSPYSLSSPFILFNNEKDYALLLCSTDPCFPRFLPWVRSTALLVRSTIWNRIHTLLYMFHCSHCPCSLNSIDTISSSSG